MRDPDEYTYTAEWSDEDRAFTGTCLEFPGCSRTAPASHLALQETWEAVRAILETGENPPEPARPPGEANLDMFLRVEERNLTDSVLFAAAEGGRTSRTGREENREWLIIGRRANIIFFDAGNGWSVVSGLETKGGVTLDEFWQDLDRLDVQARNTGHNSFPDQAQAYRDEYPGDLVPLQKRMFPVAAVRLAVQVLIETRHEVSEFIRKTQGETAEVIQETSSGGWDWVEIISVEPHPGHTAQEFWDRLQELLKE